MDEEKKSPPDPEPEPSREDDKDHGAEVEHAKKRLHP